MINPFARMVLADTLRLSGVQRLPKPCVRELADLACYEAAVNEVRLTERLDAMAAVVASLLAHDDRYYHPGATRILAKYGLLLTSLVALLTDAGEMTL